MNRGSVALLERLRDEVAGVVSGQWLPRAPGDGYVAGEVVDPDNAAAYHGPQIEAFADAGADLITVLTLTGTGEAVASSTPRATGLPVAVSFTVEMDGKLPDGTALSAAITEVDTEGRPDYFMVNSAHPDHLAPGLTDDGAWRSRIVGLPRMRPSVATRNSTQPRSWTRVTRSSSPGLRTVCGRTCRTLRSSGGVAEPTPGTSPPCGVRVDRLSGYSRSGARHPPPLHFCRADSRLERSWTSFGSAVDTMLWS